MRVVGTGPPPRRGHTHGDVDALFSRLGMLAHDEAAYSPTPSSVELELVD